LGIDSPHQRIRTDFVVVGAGVAGLRAAIELAQAGRVLIIAKDSLRESSSEYAQGGIAVALNDDDEVELHEQDTLVAGDGLCDVEAVHTLVEEAPAAAPHLTAKARACYLPARVRTAAIASYMRMAIPPAAKLSARCGSMLRRLKTSGFKALPP
jgi:ribulose 1,5-bisphosphate synthetase/thiazole synthase